MTRARTRRSQSDDEDFEDRPAREGLKGRWASQVNSEVLDARVHLDLTDLQASREHLDSMEKKALRALLASLGRMPHTGKLENLDK